MTIEGLGPIDAVQKYNKQNKLQKAENQAKPDDISFSSEAKAMGELYKATEEVKLAPDVRMDRVEEVKAKLADPNYINDKVVEGVADKLMDVFGLS